MQTKLKFWQEAATCVENIEFQFQTLAQVNAIVGYLEQWLPDESTVGLGLKELMVNAIEHGNLGIGYDTKTQLLKKGVWLQEVERRLKMPENKQKFALLRVSFSDDEIKFIIQDEGAGFDVRKYLKAELDDDELHGRGLLLAKNLAFNSLKFRNKGRRAEAVVPLG